MTKPYYLLQKAFTLTELLITLMILSILAIITTPIYSKYILTAKVNAMYKATTSAKFIVENDYYSKGNCSTSNYTYNATTQTPQFLKPTKYISSISVATGVITVNGNATKLNSNVIILTLKPSIDTTQQTIDAQQHINWTCCVNSTSFFNYVPVACKNTVATCTAKPGC